MKKILQATLVLGLIVSLAAPTFAGNGNANANGNGNSSDKVNGSTWKTQLQNEIKVNEKLELKIHENAILDDDDDQDDDGVIYNGLPYGLFKKEVLPFGLSKREELPFGLAKQIEGYWDNGLYQLDAEALIEKTETLIETAHDTYDAFENSDYTDELDALSDAIDEAEDAIDSLKEAIDNAAEGESISLTALTDAFRTLQHAVSVFSDLEVVDEDAVAALTAQIEAIEDVLNGSVYGEIQGIYPTDADEALIDYMDEIETAMDDGLTYSEYLIYSRNLTKLYDAFLDSKYAVEDEIAAYNEAVEDYQDEVAAWLTAGQVDDTDIAVISTAFYDYYKTVMQTICK
jgi:predicted  nucleic acid-binding Zn-ribbon protein